LYRVHHIVPGLALWFSLLSHTWPQGPHQGVANPNTISAKLHRFATKTGVRDSFAQGLEADCHEEVVVSKFERKNLAKVRPIPEMLP